MKRKYSKEEVWQWMSEHDKLFYYANRDDANLFIRKRYGISWTINFGNPWAFCVVCGALLAAWMIVWATR